MQRRSPLLVPIIALGLAATNVLAVDDRFDAAKYENGGFAPVKDDVYAKECGSCHFTYLPGMLPARSWHNIISGADKHFGESLSLKPDVAQHIETYLTANAADHTPYRGSELILYDLSRDATPTRITTLPLMRQRHVVISKLIRDSNTPVKRLTNCDACHDNAAGGSFAYDHINVPGVSKVIRPGGVF